MLCSSETLANFPLIIEGKSLESEANNGSGKGLGRVRRSAAYCAAHCGIAPGQPISANIERSQSYALP